MVFVTKHDKAVKKDLTIAGIVGKRTKKGHVGLEVEVESSVAGSLPRDKLGNWYFEHDGSLRGRDNGEYILSKPIDFDQVNESLDFLWGRFKEAGTRLADSNRTSVHVHLNVMPFYQNRLVSLLALWYIFEDILTHYSGDDRVGNLFCLRGKDGPAILTQLREYVENRGATALSENIHHYAALNVSQVWVHGSVEIRTLRGVLTAAPIKTWVEILKRLYDLSEKYNDPRSIIEAFSLDGPMDFFRNTFGDLAEEVYKGAEMQDDEIRASLYEGVRYAQELAYARDWTDFKPEVVTEDPFGRTKKVKPPPEPEQQQELRWGEPGQDLEQFLAEDRPRRGGRTINTLPAFNRRVINTRALIGDLEAGQIIRDDERQAFQEAWGDIARVQLRTNNPLRDVE